MTDKIISKTYGDFTDCYTIQTPLFQVKFKKLTEDAILPTKARLNDAGWDLCSNQNVVIPGLFSRLLNYLRGKEEGTTKIKTGIACEFPFGFYGKIDDRSGVSSKLLKTFGGVIDETYRGDITISIANFRFSDYKVNKGDKIAQLVIQDYCYYPAVEVQELTETDRADKGFGSSGR